MCVCVCVCVRACACACVCMCVCSCYTSDDIYNKMLYLIISFTLSKLRHSSCRNYESLGVLIEVWNILDINSINKQLKVPKQGEVEHSLSSKEDQFLTTIIIKVKFSSCSFLSINKIRAECLKKEKPQHGIHLWRKQQNKMCIWSF